MPYYFETKKIKLPKGKDRKVKLSDDDRKEIRDLYYKLGWPIRKIARLFKNKCVRKTIKMVLFPERYKRYLENARINKHWKKYYDKKKRKFYMRNHRRYKNKILQNVKLEDRKA